MRVNTISRKNFIKIIAAAGTAGVVLKSGYDQANQEQSVSQSRFLMGTLINITLVGGSAKAAREALSSSLDRMAALEGLFSRFQNNSQINQLNHMGYLNSPNENFIELLDISRQISELTAGAFDPTIAPLVSTYQRAAKESRLPVENEIQAVLPLINYQKLHFDPSRIWFEEQGMQLSLDGIAKGFIVDQGVAKLVENGYTNLMVEAGGDLTALGGNNNTPWQLGLQSPRGSLGTLSGKFSVRDRSVATSGDYFHTYSADLENHHILDPRTGYSSPELASVTVVAPSGAMADGLATGLMVLGTEESLAVVESYPAVEALLIDKSLSEEKSGGFPEIS